MTYADIPGYSGFLHLYDAAVEHFGDGAVFVEVGVALGHSVAYLARKVIDAGHKNTRIYAVDPWAGYARNGEQQAALGADGTPGDFGLFCRQMLDNAPEEFERISVLRLTSVDGAAAMFDLEKLSMVLIDGAHDRDSVVVDITAWRLCMPPGSWMCGDDHEPTYPGVQQACESVFGAGNYEVIGTSWRKVM